MRIHRIGLIMKINVKYIDTGEHEVLVWWWVKTPEEYTRFNNIFYWERSFND